MIMSMLYDQPLSFRFGSHLQNLLEDRRWSILEIGVAWVRRSGTQYLLPSLVNFLKRGGILRVSVGIDIENTSQEGLSDLLSLQAHGIAEIYIYHNEASSTFHPKVYLFSNQQDAKLIVGSNNITEAGLFVNVEASLEVEAPIDDSVISNAKAALADWRDPSLKLALALDSDLLSDLVRLRYVMSEATLRARRRQQSSRSTFEGERASPLFGRVAVTAPVWRILREARPKPTQISDEEPRDEYQSDLSEDDGGVNLAEVTQNTGKVLLMRVRRASAARRRTQTQLPLRLYRDAFFEGVTELISAHDNTRRQLSPAQARGGVNTLKLEIPEMRDFDDPVLRLEHTAQGVIYRAFDASSVLGRPIMEALSRGITMSPPETHLTTPGNLDSSTMWRFI